MLELWRKEAENRSGKEDENRQHTRRASQNRSLVLVATNGPVEEQSISRLDRI